MKLRELMAVDCAVLRTVKCCKNVQKTWQFRWGRPGIVCAQILYLQKCITRTIITLIVILCHAHFHWCTLTRSVGVSSATEPVGICWLQQHLNTNHQHTRTRDTDSTQLYAWGGWMCVCACLCVCACVCVCVRGTCSWCVYDKHFELYILVPDSWLLHEQLLLYTVRKLAIACLALNIHATLLNLMALDLAESGYAWL